MKFKVYTFLNQRLILSNGFECQFKDGVYETEDNELIELLKKVPNVHCEKPSILASLKENQTVSVQAAAESEPAEESKNIDENAKRGRPAKK